MDNLSLFSLDDVKFTVRKETDSAENFIPSSQPRATLLAGQPGAGKTVLSSMLSSQYHDNAILINGDDYRRFHPHYRELFERYGADSVPMTSAFSGAVTEALIDELSNRRFNLIVEGTGRTVEVPKKTAELLADKGYTVRMAAIAVRPEMSLLSTVMRFYEMSESGTLPRATAIEAHDHIVDVLPDNLDRLKELPQIAGMNIWTRELREIYGDMTKAAPSDVLRQYWSRPWTVEERADALDALRLLRDKESQLHLGQGSAIGELERRLNCSFAERPLDPVAAAAQQMVEEAAARQIGEPEHDL